jgi:hypothetical protein
MAVITTPDPLAAGPYGGAATAPEAPVSAVSWPAVFAGAFVATAFTIMLLSLGSGLGLASVSPFTANPSATTFTVLAAIWLIIVQWVSSALGGYITGRLRTRWVAVHTREVFFRDTANGLLSWAVASVFLVGIVASSASSLLGTGTHAVASVAAGAAQNPAASPSAYMLDTLFRPTNPGGAQATAADKAEAATILAQGAAGPVSQPDQAYLAQLVAARTGVAQSDAQARVTTAIAQEQAAVAKAKQVANAARKAASGFALYTFASMLIGAFIAAVSGALGGRLRDTR